MDFTEIHEDLAAFDLTEAHCGLLRMAKSTTELYLTSTVSPITSNNHKDASYTLTDSTIRVTKAAGFLETSSKLDITLE